MIVRKIEFLTVASAAIHLVGQDFRQDDAGNWRRADDGATAEIAVLCSNGHHAVVASGTLPRVCSPSTKTGRRTCRE